MRSRLITATLVALLGTATPAAATTDAPSRVGASQVRAEVHGVAGLDRLTVWGGSRPSSLHVTPGATQICVSAERTSFWTTARRTRMKETSWEYGCVDTSKYTFRPDTWQASAQTVVPTTVWRTRYEWSSSGWQSVESHAVGSSKATVRVSWRGTGSQQVQPWVSPPGLCYTYPPSVCGVGGGAAVERDATVAGTVQLHALATTAALGHDAGRIRWWLSAGSGSSRTTMPDPGVPPPRICSYSLLPKICWP